MGLLIHGAMVQGLCHDESFMEHSLECCYAAVIRWVSVKVSVGVISWQELHGALSGALSCCSHEQCMKRINIRVRGVPWQELPGALSCCSCRRVSVERVRGRGKRFMVYSWECCQAADVR